MTATFPNLGKLRYPQFGPEGKLVGMWSPYLVFNTAMTVYDLSQRGNHLTCTNFTPGTDWVSQSAVFPTLGGFAQSYVAGLPTVTTQPWTLCGWHATTVFGSLCVVAGFGLENQLSTPADNYGKQRTMIQYLNNYYYWGANADWDTGVLFDLDGRQHQWVVTYDSVTMRFFRDGSERASRSGLPSGSVNAGSYAWIGGRHPSAASQTSRINEFAIYGRALTGSEIELHYRLGPGGSMRRQRRWLGFTAAAPPTYTGKTFKAMRLAR